MTKHIYRVPARFSDREALTPEYGIPFLLSLMPGFKVITEGPLCVVLELDSVVGFTNFNNFITRTLNEGIPVGYRVTTAGGFPKYYIDYPNYMAPSCPLQTCLLGLLDSLGVTVAKEQADTGV